MKDFFQKSSGQFFFLWGSFLSVDRLSSQHLFAGELFYRSFCFQIRRKLGHSFSSFEFSRRCWTSLQHLALVGSNNFWRYLTISDDLCVSFARIREISRKLDRRTNTLEFSRAIFSTLQTKSTDVPKRPWSLSFRVVTHLEMKKIQFLVWEENSKTSRQFDGHFGLNNFIWNNLRMAKSLSRFYPEFGDVHFILRFYGNTSTGRGSTKILGKK